MVERVLPFQSQIHFSIALNWSLKEINSSSLIQFLYYPILFLSQQNLAQQLFFSQKILFILSSITRRLYSHFPISIHLDSFLSCILHTLNSPDYSCTLTILLEFRINFTLFGVLNLRQPIDLVLAAWPQKTQSQRGPQLPKGRTHQLGAWLLALKRMCLLEYWAQFYPQNQLTLVLFQLAQMSMRLQLGRLQSRGIILLAATPYIAAPLAMLQLRLRVLEGSLLKICLIIVLMNGIREAPPTNYKLWSLQFGGILFFMVVSPFLIQLSTGPAIFSNSSLFMLQLRSQSQIRDQMLMQLSSLAERTFLCFQTWSKSFTLALGLLKSDSASFRLFFIFSSQYSANK